MSEPIIRIDGLHKSYGANAVLRGIDLQVHAGEYFALVGVNGAGKTTLLKCLLDFASPDSGAIRLAGIDAGTSNARAVLAYLPEKFNPPYYLAGSDFLDYMAALHGVDFAADRLQHLLGMLDLDRAALAKPARQLSKGMSQKLGLLAALLSGRPLLVLDEPMSGLDPKVRAGFKHHLLAEKGRGRTLFFSTHLLADVEALCDRLAVLHAGRIAFVGTPAECCRKFQAADLEQAYLNCVSAG